MFEYQDMMQQEFNNANSPNLLFGEFSSNDNLLNQSP